MLRDFLQDSWTFQETLQEGREQGRVEGHVEGLELGLERGRVEGRKQGHVEGLERGRVEGREQGRVEEARLIIERLVEKRFPMALDETKMQIGQIANLQRLQAILSALFTAETEEEAIQSLRSRP